MNTLILTCSTGQGHNSCAKAIQEYYLSQGQPAVIEDALGFVSPTLSRIICRGHVTIYRHMHSLFQAGYRYSEKHSGLFAEDSAFCRLLARGTGRLRSYILAHQIDTVICTHVFASLMLTRLQKDAPLPIHTGLVATDYTCNPGTKESMVDRYFIPDPPLSVRYACPSIPADSLISSGIPIRQMFCRVEDRKEARRRLGLPEDQPHLLMMCGSMGCGPMKKLAARLVRTLPEHSCLTIVCGTNKRLETNLRRRYGCRPGVRILGYVEDISLLMDSADLYLTKPGGISVTEAAMKNLPMVFVDAVAGCEAYNMIYFIRLLAARTAPTVRELAALCTDLLDDPRQLQQMRQALETTEKRNAAKIIFDEMNKLTECNANEISHPCC